MLTSLLIFSVATAKIVQLGFLQRCRQDLWVEVGEYLVQCDV
jgi:hypothetical protein